MSEELRTRQTLIYRLSDKADDDSWAEFAEIYTPLLYGYCLRRELKQTDAADIVQEVMRSVSLALSKKQYDPEKGKFKNWLFTCVRNAINTHFRKASRRPLTVAQTGLLESLNTEPAGAEQEAWERDYQQQLLAWAVEKIHPEFAPRVWRAFEATALQDISPAEVAAEIGMTRNGVAIAKHRVLKRLKEKVNSIDALRWEQEMIARKRAV